MLDVLAQPHNSRTYVQIGMIMVLNKTIVSFSALCIAISEELLGWVKKLRVKPSVTTVAAVCHLKAPLTKLFGPVS
jgi:hypothetical protein